MIDMATKDDFNRGTTYRAKTDYCPECNDVEAVFRYVRTETHGCCDGGARRRFECVGCGLARHYPRARSGKIGRGF